ncbi:hypothetical protein LLE49_13625 [Alicyclobacillus tolerans]|uniref:hypothetical protein n=1 Tax=Alicyclobacillus tolerans TaxID=90970 RepID=UPI001F4181B8|nr:hypothetical protein [Alicyclobacillus tolerans]MCF8565758.1 hypothetical protein [Alicyclobacillus tolerans]
MLAQLNSIPKVTQGVTTEIIGNYGFSVAPIRHTEAIESFRLYSTPVLGFPNQNWDWKTYREYTENVQDAGPVVNYASLIGHSTLRCAVMGFDARRPSTNEIEQMKELLAQAMQEGALGMSTGLVY